MNVFMSYMIHQFVKNVALNYFKFIWPVTKM